VKETRITVEDTDASSDHRAPAAAVLASRTIRDGLALDEFREKLRVLRESE